MAAGSLQRINKFALGEARTHKKFFIIANIILGMGGLLYLFLSGYSKYDRYSEDDALGTMTVSFEPSWLGLFLLGVGSCIGLMAAASIFRDMNNVQLGDVQLSLPMTANERYLSKLLALFYIHVLPVLVWLGLPTLVHTLRCKAEGVDSAEYLPTIFLALVTIMLFINCITVLCSVCCGALAETIYFTIIAIVCISVAPALLWYTLAETCAGQSTDPGYVFSVWSLSFVLNVEDADDNIAKFNCMLMLNSAISVIVMLLMSFVYRRRDARTVGTPIANRVFFECIMFGGLATVYAIFFFRTEAYIGIIIVAVIYMVIHIISSRGKLSVKKFLGWLGKFALSTAVYVALAGAAYATGGFGMVKHLPAYDLGNSIIEISLYTDYEVEKTTLADSGKSHYTHFYLGNRDPLNTDQATDQQVREMAGLFQKYAANRERTVSDFFRSLNGEAYGYRIDRYRCRLSVQQHRKGIDGRGREYGTTETVISQNIEFTPDEANALADELRALGDIGNNSSEPGIDHEYYY